MDHFLFVIINVLLLAVIVFVFGRKTVVSIFRTRREKINGQLEEAEKIEHAETPKISDALTEIPTVDNSELLRIQSDAEAKIERMKSTVEEECVELHREMVTDVKADAVKLLRDKAAEMLSEEPYCSALRQKEPEMVRMILDKIKLTPGDMSYIKYNDVLYVTLTSAFPLAQELVDEIGEATDKLLAQVNAKTSYWVRVDPELIGGLRLRIGDSVYDCTVAEELYRLSNTLNKQLVTGGESAEDLLASFSQTIKQSHSSVKLYEYQLGRVITVSDGICWMDGLADIMYGEVVEFECGERGMVLDIQHDRIGCVIYGRYEHIESGSKVRRVGRIASVPVGDKLLGRVVDPLGHAIDGKGKIRTSKSRPIECRAPGIPDRAPVNVPLHTGLRAIDALVPIGRGQRELIIGDRQTGKTSIAIDTIINQKGKDVICIYVAIGQKETTVADIRQKLDKYGAMDYTTIVCATASESASLQYIAPFAGTAMGEHYMAQGRDVLIVYDDLSKHAVAYRELSLLLHRPSGREAYPGDIFYLHSRLLERSARLSEEMGGGSMTALPIIETLAGDISSYIPTNVISITDGQIFLDTDLFHSGQRPAINVGLSVSRVGGTAQTKLLKQVTSSLRMILAQYRELLGFTQFGSDIDVQTQKVLDSGGRMMAALRQNRYRPLDDWKQALLIYAVSAGYADKIQISDMERFEEGLYGFFENSNPVLVEILKTGKKMDEAVKADVNKALAEYSEGF